MITITEAAKWRLFEVKLKNKSRYIRLDVKGGGCAGFNYEWSFTDTKEDNDMLLENVLLISKDLEFYLLGTELDYIDEAFKSEFVIRNPNSKSSCGCGESFSI